MKKKYELQSSVFGEMLKAELEDGGVWWIPLDPANSDYAEYLRYTEWVEAGNDPDEFWSQSEDFLTLSESNETEAI